MIFLFLIYYLYLTYYGFTNAAPISSIAERATSESSCDDIHNCRTLWNIIWSCLTVVFSCTWVAVHPNVPEPPKPSPKDASFQGRLRAMISQVWASISHRGPLFVIALLVPEYVLAWAIRQFLQAHKIEKKYKGWTMTHGFFVIMGGFHLYERKTMDKESSLLNSHADDEAASQEDDFLIPRTNDIPVHPLAIWHLTSRDKDGNRLKFNFTMPTEEEIQVRGKSDWLAKTLVLIQTTWYILQCIARRIEHLPVTHLEIVTLGYATMSFAMYLFWWNKPLNVTHPIRVYKGEGELSENKAMQWKEGWFGWLQRIWVFIVGWQDVTVTLSRETKVPRFWSGGKLDESFSRIFAADGLTAVVGIVFGAIHCIAWSFALESQMELKLWHISSIVILLVPIFLVVLVFSAAGIYYDTPNTDSSKMVHVAISFGIFLIPAVPLYIFARIATVVLAFKALGILEPDAYRTVEWTTFIPHI